MTYAYLKVEWFEARLSNGGFLICLLMKIKIITFLELPTTLANLSESILLGLLLSNETLSFDNIHLHFFPALSNTLILSHAHTQCVVV